MCRIQKATISDLPQLVQLTQDCTRNLISQGIFQWNENYPSSEILERDLALEQIWKLEINSTIAGIIVLTEIEDMEYKKVKWLTESSNNLYVHRLAIHPDYQRKGYARKLMDFGETYAEENNYCSVRLDTFSQNKRNQKFYEARNYSKLGRIYFLKQSEHPFYCYELILNVQGIKH